MAKKITDAQLKTLPHYLRLYDGLDEDGNTPLSRRAWEAKRMRALGLEPAGPRKVLPAKQFTKALLAETLSVLFEFTEKEPAGALRDRAIALGTVLVSVKEAVDVRYAAQAQHLSKARKMRGAPTGRPKIPLLVTAPNGDTMQVDGYTEAGVALGKSANAIRVAMTRDNGKAQFGRRRDGSDCWTVERVGTNNALLQEACQKPENDVHEKDESS